MRKLVLRALRVMMRRVTSTKHFTTNNIVEREQYYYSCLIIR